MTTATARPAVRPLVRAIAPVAAAAVVASVADLVVATAAIAAGASADYPPLQAPALVAFSVGGVVAGLVGWVLVRRSARRPAPLLRVLVPLVVVLSLIPDLLVAPAIPGASTTAVVALMLMHVVVAAVAVPVYRAVAPLPADRG